MKFWKYRSGRASNHIAVSWLLPLALLVLLALGLALPGQAQARELVVKLGTLAPEGSPWYNHMRAMGEEWEKASGGQVKLKIYPGGVTGHEGQILSKMKIGQLHAAILTATGLSDLDRGPLALQLPMVISSYEELDYVLGAMGPTLEKRLEAKGFKVLTWGDAGWVHFFSKMPVSTIAQLKQVKIYAWAGDPAATAAFQSAGLKPVTVASTDVLMSLQTGMVEGFPATPLSALSLQWFGLAPNMVNLKWSPFVGATVIDMRAWEKIPSELQPTLLAIARKHGDNLKKDVRKLDDDAVELMKKNRLAISEPIDLAEWQAFAAEFRKLLRGTVMDAGSVDRVQELHKLYQQRSGAVSPR